jgi:hypothetical protein
LTFSLFTIAKKNSARGVKPITAKRNSSREDSISGMKRSSFNNIVRIAIKPNAADTNINLFDLMFLYAINDRAKRIAAKIHVSVRNVSGRKDTICEI